MGSLLDGFAYREKLWPTEGSRHLDHYPTTGHRVVLHFLPDPKQLFSQDLSDVLLALAPLQEPFNEHRISAYIGSWWLGDQE